MVDELDLHRQSVSTGLRMADDHQLNILVVERPGRPRPTVSRDRISSRIRSCLLSGLSSSSGFWSSNDGGTASGPPPGGEELVVKPVGRLLVVNKLARAAPRVGQKEVEPRHLDLMTLLSKYAVVVGDIEGQDG